MLQLRWNSATARERLLVMAMVSTVLCAVLIALLVRPAWRLLQSAPATLNALDAKVLTMRAQAVQLRATPAAPSAMISPPLFAEREMAGPGATVTVVRDAASAGHSTTTVNLKGVESVLLAAWLAKPEVQKQMQRLNFARDAATGRINGTVVLRTPS